MANPMSITSMTVSLELKRSTYGGADAENRYVQLRAEVPTGADGLTPDEALVQSLTLHLKVWESLYGAEVAAGKIKTDEFNLKLERLRKRIAKLAAFLTTEEPTHE